MQRYDNEQLEELCDKVSLYDYASKTFDFKKNSGNYFCSCPLHTDITPSLSINKERNKFHCFSCGVGGSIIDWMRIVEDLSFKESVQKLSGMVGMDIQDLKTSDTVAFYKKISNLSTKKKQENSREYLDDNYYKQFSEELPEEWIKEGISEDAMKEYEIRIDKKSNRIVYPVYDKDLRLIGAKGRTRFINYKDFGVAKYMNYKPIGTIDYFSGWKQSKDFVRDSGTVIIFEGIKSCMKAYDYGIKNTVSAETSCLTIDQIKFLIKNQVKEVIFAFDTDVDIKKIIECSKDLKMFAKISVVKNKQNLLGDKESPVDRGKEIFLYLLERRVSL